MCVCVCARARARACACACACVRMNVYIYASMHVCVYTSGKQTAWSKTLRPIAAMTSSKGAPLGKIVGTLTEIKQAVTVSGKEREMSRGVAVQCRLPSGRPNLICVLTRNGRWSLLQKLCWGQWMRGRRGICGVFSTYCFSLGRSCIRFSSTGKRPK